MMAASTAHLSSGPGNRSQLTSYSSSPPRWCYKYRAKADGSLDKRSARCGVRADLTIPGVHYIPSKPLLRLYHTPPSAYSTPMRPSRPYKTLTWKNGTCQEPSRVPKPNTTTLTSPANHAAPMAQSRNSIATSKSATHSNGPQMQAIVGSSIATAASSTRLDQAQK